MTPVSTTRLDNAGAGTSAASLEAAEEIRSTSGRRDTSFPVRKKFVRAGSPDAPPPPLAQLVERRALVALKLYLALVWRSASPPYDTNKTARGWATLLDLPKPDTSGAARIRAARATLAEIGLTEVIQRAANEAPALRLLNESGDRAPYELPSTSYFKEDRGGTSPFDNPNMYLQVPTALWTEGLLQQMSMGALSMLLILLAERADRGDGVWFSTAEFPNRYRISAPTRSRGTKELVEAGLLRTRRMPLSNPNGSQIFDQRKTRKRYRLTGTAAALGSEPGLFWDILEDHEAQGEEAQGEASPSQNEAKPQPKPAVVKPRRRRRPSTK